MLQGKRVYDKHCAACHGADLKGLPDQHTPDLTDAEWQYSGDDLASGGLVKLPSDVEWTVRYGIRSDHPNARGLEADMLAYNPKFRTEEDTKEFGDKEFLTPAEIDDVVEYVLEISGQQSDAAKAARGKVLFHDGAKGNCFDCHSDDATGNPPIGSTNLTEKRLYLYGADRASILEVGHQGAPRRHAGLRGHAQARGDQGGVGLRPCPCRKLNSGCRLAGMAASTQCRRSAVEKAPATAEAVAGAKSGEDETPSAGRGRRVADGDRSRRMTIAI